MPLAENCAGGAEEEKVEDSDKISAAEISYLQKVIRRGLLDSHQDLKVQRKDPNSPLFCEKLPIPQFVSWFNCINLQSSNFLHSLILISYFQAWRIVDGYLYAMGFDAPSKIQEMVLPILLDEV